MIERVGLIATIVLTVGVTPAAGASEPLELARRIEAQRALETLRHAYRVDSRRSFDEVVPPALLERRVRTYLKQSVLLERRWNVGITGEMLQRELERMVRGTRFPERLREQFDALDNDPLLLLEALARPSLVDRLSRSYFAADRRIHGPDGPEQTGRRRAIGWEAWWSEIAPELDENAVTPVRPPGGPTPRPEQARSSCLDDFTWDNGSLGAVPDPRSRHTLVWTGSEMIVWGGEFGGNAVGDGARYDPVIDHWSRIADDGAPTPRRDHTAVWTGSEMIVWGGDNQDTGGRYDPATDTWSPTSTIGAPAGRRLHAAVWSGSRMVVFSGRDGGGLLPDGGRYSPASDSWLPLSAANAPAARQEHTMVWTGTAAIVWGGQSGNDYLADGGRYDPLTDSWLPTALTAAPEGRTQHTAVWTGDRMIVWGGHRSSATLDDGGIYDPATDAWSALSSTNAPTARRDHAAVWTGDEMLVWGGGVVCPAGNPEDTGGAYHPQANAWRTLSTTHVPYRRCGPRAVWAGDRMIVWGGRRSVAVHSDEQSGGQYDPVTDSWTPTSLGGAPQARLYHTAVWSGSEMIVWGGVGDDGGGRYDPVTDTWLAVTTIGAPEERAGHVAVWTGDEMLAWGGGDPTGKVTFDSGALYDPASDLWSPMAEGPLEARGLATAVRAGDRVLIWGGSTPFVGPRDDGAAYFPATNTWAPISAAGAPSARYDHTAVWTGSRMVIWGGRNASFSLGTGGGYDPMTDQWTTLSSAGAPVARVDHTAVWTGDEMIVWGGRSGTSSVQYGNGARYDPLGDDWAPMSDLDAPSARHGHTAVATGAGMLVWGGVAGDNVGGYYVPQLDTWTPVTSVGAPAPRTDHTAVWAPGLMVVWGGLGPYRSGGRFVVEQTADVDGDGVSACLGDCDDSDAGVLSVPQEIAGLHFPDKVTVEWASVAAGSGPSTVYDVMRGSISELPVGSGAAETCEIADGAGLTAGVPKVPQPGQGFYYLARGDNTCRAGTYGAESAGVERASTTCH